MSVSNLEPLPDYQELKNYLEVERNTLVKNYAFAEEDDFIRSTEDAGSVLDFLERIQKRLWDLFSQFPSLMKLFNEEFYSFREFVHRDFILELCFIHDHFFAEKELLLFGKGKSVDLDKLREYVDFFHQWAEDQERRHVENQALIKENFKIEIRSKDMSCSCVSCVADYRSKLRETVFGICTDTIEETHSLIEENIDQGIATVNKKFHFMQKNLDKQFHSFRYRFKRGTFNRLESQVKAVIRDKFTYPADLAKRYSETIKDFFRANLKKEGLRSDLISEEQYQRFFKQLKTNLWGTEKKLEKEYKKFIKSVLMLKRKDISAGILKDHLGQFWTHSSARQIKRKIVYHVGPTNSGKTYNAINSLCKAKKGCYLAPLRLLAAELYDTMNGRGVKTTLLTGEEIIETDDATHYSSTIEMARFQEVFDCCVIDEIQMMTDPQRGWAWTRALVNIFSPEIHICGDDSVMELVYKIAELCGDSIEVKTYERMTDLTVTNKKILVGDLEKGDALIVFSRKNALRYKYDLEQLGFKVSIVYGRLSPEVRREQARKFDVGETDIMVSTDAISMGMNLPIKRIVFSTLSKFIDSREHIISNSEIRQIGGRAGRYLRFPEGKITCLEKVERGIQKIQKAMQSTAQQRKKSMVGPDLEIFVQVNEVLSANSLPILKLSEFLRLFNTMTFKRPFYCVDLREMIELAEMVEDADPKGKLGSAEIFGFACAPVNMGLLGHIEHYVWILNRYVNQLSIPYESLDHTSNDIDYLETSIKCVELYQWLARHFDDKNFDYDDIELKLNKSNAISKLNELLSDKIVPTCSSCGKKLGENTQFPICETCFRKRRFGRGGGSGRSYGGRGGRGGRGGATGTKRSGSGRKRLR